jgi:hypothetical protein
VSGARLGMALARLARSLASRSSTERGGGVTAWWPGGYTAQATGARNREAREREVEWARVVRERKGEGRSAGGGGGCIEKARAPARVSREAAAGEWAKWAGSAT